MALKMILRVRDYVVFVGMGLAYGPTYLLILGRLWFDEKMAKFPFWPIFYCRIQDFSFCVKNGCFFFTIPPRIRKCMVPYYCAARLINATLLHRVLLTSFVCGQT